MNDSFKKTILFGFLALSAITGLAGCKNVESIWSVERNSTSSDFTNSVIRDATGDIIVTADSFVTKGNMTSESFVVVKFNDSGNLVWDYSYEDKSSRVFAVDSDSNGNIFVAGSNSNGVYLLKLYPNGTKAWELDNLEGDWITGGLAIYEDKVFFACKTIYALDIETGEIVWNGTNDLKITDLKCDNAGNLYVAGYDFMASYDTSGRLRWKNDSENSSGEVKIVFNSTEDLFASYYLSQKEIKLEKINKETGSLIASRTETGSGIWAPQIGCDNNENIILAYSCDNTSNGRKVLKYNGSLVKAWGKSFESGSVSMDLSDMAVSSSGDIYITGGNTTTKIDSSGKKVISIKTDSVYTNNYLAFNEDQSNIYLASSADHPNNKNIILKLYNTK